MVSDNGEAPVARWKTDVLHKQRRRRGFDGKKLKEMHIVPRIKSRCGRWTYEAVSSKGYVTFYLTNGPEYHSSQITDAVMVAKHLGATLVLPDIRGSKPGTLKISSSLELQPGVSDLVESMIQRLKKSGGRFEAIDLRVENLRYLRRRIAVRQEQWWDPRLVTTHKRSRCS
ncbi:hypothetical protein Bca4012_020261 [Brassica carinata]